LTPVQIGAASLFNKMVKTIAKIRTSKQLEIWSLVKKKQKSTSQREIWGKTINKPKKAKVPDALLKNFKKIKTAKNTADRKISELSKDLAAKLRHVDPRYPNDYLNRQIVKLKTKLRIWGLSKRMLSRLDSPTIDLNKLAEPLNSNIQRLFKFEKTNSFQKEILSSLNSLAEKCSSNSTSTLEKREAYLEIIQNIRNLHVSLYNTHVSRGKQIKEFNELMDNLFGK
jgi:uncharacterized protein (UPF0305 family)